jgi:hypothetical protein
LICSSVLSVPAEEPGVQINLRKEEQAMMRRIFQLFPVVGAILLLLSGCTASTGSYGGSSSSSSGSSGGGGTSTNTAPDWGVQTKTTSCQANGALQDKACTPGDIIKTATKAQICVPGYAGKTRNVPQSEKNQVYAEYGIKSHRAGQYEVDHLVSLQLGGSNDISNLWPEAASPKPGFHEKDKVENYLHDQMCKGNMTLTQVQTAIATNWLDVYNSMPSNSKNGGGSSSDGSA